MDIQSIITLIIVAVAVALAIRHLWRVISKAGRQSDGSTPPFCEGCAMRDKCLNNKGDNSKRNCAPMSFDGRHNIF